MEKVLLEERQLFGSTVRTTNRNEMSPNGKIGPLWQSAIGQLMQKGYMDSVVYGVYSSYESDHQGEFDCSVMIDTSVGFEHETVVTIPAGLYLKFEKSGECPAACMELWQEIWAYFEQDGSPRRKYGVDFEEYVSKTDVAIYIGIEGE